MRREMGSINGSSTFASTDHALEIISLNNVLFACNESSSKAFYCLIMPFWDLFVCLFGTTCVPWR